MPRVVENGRTRREAELTCRRGLPGSARLGSAAAAAGGVALFVWTIHAAGLTAVADGVARLGAGFLVVMILGGWRFMARAAAWRLCFDSPGRLSIWDAFAAVVAGDSIATSLRSAL
jgi:hypothetical protein